MEALSIGNVDLTDCQLTLSRLQTLEPEHVEIIAGHYCLADELTDLSSDCATEELSFRVGAALHMSLRKLGISSRMVLWVNDIGICSSLREKLKLEYQLPDNYIEILRLMDVDPRNVHVIFESSSRNKASTSLRKKMKKKPDVFLRYDSSDPKLVRCIPGNYCDIAEPTGVTAYAIMGPDGYPLVMKEGPNPKCNLILATLFEGSAAQYQNTVFVNVFNSIYIERIRLGIHVAQAVFGLTSTFINMFCDDDSCFIQDLEPEVELHE
jgi:hypothetical protein